MHLHTEYVAKWCPQTAMIDLSSLGEKIFLWFVPNGNFTSNAKQHKERNATEQFLLWLQYPAGAILHWPSRSSLPLALGVSLICIRWSIRPETQGAYVTDLHRWAQHQCTPTHFIKESEQACTDTDKLKSPRFKKQTCELKAKGKEKKCRPMSKRLHKSCVKNCKR